MNADATAELLLSDPRTGEDFRDDAKQIAHQSSILVRRVPALRHDALEAKPAAPAAAAAVPGLAPDPSGELSSSHAQLFLDDCLL